VFGHKPGIKRNVLIVHNTLNNQVMKKLSLFLLMAFSLFVFGCSKTEKSERFKLLTTPVWTSDSLLANKQNAGGTGGLLEKFKGDAKFKDDGTGTFGSYVGQWAFNKAETEITILSDSLTFPVVCNIVELLSTSLKITTVVPDKTTLVPIDIRMTFKVK
jgi:hypothetical protein